MLSAEEARKLAEKPGLEALEYVEQKIKRAAECGQYQSNITLDKHVEQLPFLTKMLEEAGYGVTYDYNRIRVTWLALTLEELKELNKE